MNGSNFLAEKTHNSDAEEKNFNETACRERVGRSKSNCFLFTGEYCGKHNKKLSNNGNIENYTKPLESVSVKTGCKLTIFEGEKL